MGDHQTQSLWRMRLCSALRMALACIIVGCTTLYGPPQLQKFSVLTLWLVEPKNFSVGVAAAAAALSAFVVALLESTHLMSKRIAFRQFVNVYVATVIHGAQTRVVMHPLGVASSIALGALASIKLRLYKPPPLPYDDNIEEQRIEETTGKVVSQVGFAESDTPVARDPEKFRPKRVAVLIYFFEENADDLHVILVPMTVEDPPDKVSPLLLSPRPSPVSLARFATPVDLPQTCYIQFDYLVYYEKTITGKLTYGAIIDLKEIQVQRFFFWFNADKIRNDLPPSDSIYFTVGIITDSIYHHLIAFTSDNIYFTVTINPKLFFQMNPYHGAEVQCRGGQRKLMKEDKNFLSDKLMCRPPTQKERDTIIKKKGKSNHPLAVAQAPPTGHP
ncbi:hypothetical protein ACFX1W_006516 [Malus domestica]